MHEVNPVGDVLINEIPWDCLEIVFRVFYLFVTPPGFEPESKV